MNTPFFPTFAPWCVCVYAHRRLQVYDVTPYLGQHPGGLAILRNAGGDSTEGMSGPQHPPQAMEILEQHFIGLLEA